jgi:hypothetical protein
MVCGSFQNTMHKCLNTGSSKERTNLRNDDIYMGLVGRVMVFNTTFNNIHGDIYVKPRQCDRRLYKESIKICTLHTSDI